jgi:hypothetical protein
LWAGFVAIPSIPSLPAFVIASGAKQSRAACHTLDCRAASPLAMTIPTKVIAR